MTRFSATPIIAILVVLLLSGARACAQPVTVSIHTASPVTNLPVFRPGLIGFNLPAGHSREQTRRSAVLGPGTNGVWEALRDLNPGLIRVWTSAYECFLDTMQLPPYEADADGPWEEWLGRVLSDDSPHWAEFDQYMTHVATLGESPAVMLCIPAFPPWLGPFRAPSADADLNELIDLRTGERVPYGTYLEWAGLENRMISEGDAFRRFAPRVEAFVERLVSHCLRHGVIGPTIRYVSLGNEPDNPGKTARYVCWRLWVYGAKHSERMEAGTPLSLTDEGALQQVYFRVHAGVRAVAGAQRIGVGGPETAWAHTQRMSKGAFYYLDYFVRGGSPYYPDAADTVKGVTPGRLDFLSYHSYSVRPEPRFQHDRIVSELFDAYGRPVFLTEYNATAAGHGMNMMQGGAAAVADAMIRLGRHPHAGGAAFFKGSGGGFGLVLNRSNGEKWYTGAYWTLDLFSRWFVGGQPVRLETSAEYNVDGIAVRQKEGGWVAAILNRTEEPVDVRVTLDSLPASPLVTRTVALPIAADRNDYRHVSRSEIIAGTLPPRERYDLTMAPKGIVFLRSPSKD